MNLEEIFSFENLYSAYKNCRKSRQHKGEIIRFETNLSFNLINLSKDLISKRRMMKHIKTMNKLYNNGLVDKKYVYIRKNAFYNHIKNTQESKKLKKEVKS